MKPFSDNFICSVYSLDCTLRENIKFRGNGGRDTWGEGGGKRWKKGRRGVEKIEVGKKGGWWKRSKLGSRVGRRGQEEKGVGVR